MLKEISIVKSLSFFQLSTYLNMRMDFVMLISFSKLNYLKAKFSIITPGRGYLKLKIWHVNSFLSFDCFSFLFI